MTRNVVGRWIGRASLAGGLAITFAGCPDSPAEITESASPPAFNFPVATVFDEPPSPFAVNRLTIAGIDTSVTDAFGRARTFNTVAPNFISFVSGCPAAGNRCPGRQWPIRNVNADNRLPTLQDPDAAALLGIVADSVFGVPLLLLSTAGLEASTQHTVTLERRALTLNAGLDVPNILLNSPNFGGFALSPDAPDALTLLGGTPGTTLGSNPYTIATITTNASGGGFFTPGFTGSDANLETNSFKAFDLPNYNYLVVYLGDPATGVPVLRAQIGVDLDASGNPVNNAQAPFPTAAFTIPQMVAAPGGAGRPDSLRVTFDQLEALTGGALYEAWLVNPTTGLMRLATGRYNLLKIIAERDPITGEITSTRDSLVDSIPGTSSFVGGNTEDGFRHQLVLSDAALAGGPEDSLGFYTHLFLTIDQSPGDATVSPIRPFWFQYTDQGGTPTDFFDDDFTVVCDTVDCTDQEPSDFGVFDPGNPAASRSYSAQGIGLGGVRDDVLSVDLDNLSRPPVGYQYVAWLVPGSGAAFRLPDITGPPPERLSLVDSDVEFVEGLVTPTGILEANFRVVASDLGIVFSDFVNFMITLEPKAGEPSKGPLDVILGPLPARVVAP